MNSDRLYPYLVVLYGLHEEVGCEYWEHYPLHGVPHHVVGQDRAKGVELWKEVNLQRGGE